MLSRPWRGSLHNTDTTGNRELRCGIFTLRDRSSCLELTTQSLPLYAGGLPTIPRLPRLFIIRYMVSKVQTYYDKIDFAALLSSQIRTNTSAYWRRAHAIENSERFLVVIQVRGFRP
jgi:hypothetical protein